MDSITLTSQELAYVLTLVGATGVCALEHPHVPPSEADADSVYTNGLEQLKAHGWLSPGDQADEFELDDRVLDIATALANPEFVTITVRETKQAVQHYITPAFTLQMLALKSEEFRFDIVREPLEMGAAVVLFLRNDVNADAPASLTPPKSLPTQTGEFALVKASGADIVAGRKAAIHGNAWLSYRISRDSEATRVKPLVPETIAETVSEFIRSLDGAG